MRSRDGSYSLIESCALHWGPGCEEGIHHHFEEHLVHIPEELADGVITPAVMQEQEFDLSGCDKC